jgi:hypothetical protein
MWHPQSLPALATASTKQALAAQHLQDKHHHMMSLLLLLLLLLQGEVLPPVMLQRGEGDNSRILPLLLIGLGEAAELNTANWGHNSYHVRPRMSCHKLLFHKTAHSDSMKSHSLHELR